VVADPAGEEVPATAMQRLGLPTGRCATVGMAVLTASGVTLRSVPVRCIELVEGLPALLAVPLHEAPAYRRPPDSVRAWAVAARLALRVVAGHRLAPTLRRSPGGPLRASWCALVDDDAAAAGALARLAASFPPTAHAVALDHNRVWDPAGLVRAFVDAVADTAVRHGGPPPRAGRPRDRLLPWTARWAEALGDPDDPVVPIRDDPDELVAAVTGWLSGGSDSAAGVTELRLEAPVQQADPWPLHVALRMEDGSLLPAERVWAGDTGDTDPVVAQEAILRGLARCARVFEPVDRGLREAEPTCVPLTVEEAWTFICDAEPLLRGSDVVVILPSDVAEEDLRLRLQLGGHEPGAAGADEAAALDSPDGVDLHDVADLPDHVDYAFQVTIGDEVIGDDELVAIAEAQTPLVRWRDRWLRVDPDQVGRLRNLSPSGRLGLADALVLGLGGSVGAGDVAGLPLDDARPGTRVEVVAEGRLANLLDRIRGAAEIPAAAPTPPGFQGVLRPYQGRGVAWLAGMSQLGLGAVLADDMGLGKGIQLIAYLLSRSDARPALVVCPTSVVGNWQRELRRFAPSVAVTRWHGADRPGTGDQATGVVLTTYGTLRRDIDVLAAVDWGVIALDEAQHVKNPQTAAARAVRRLRSQQTVALTGTPLENRLAELWALLDATNPGLLGSQAAFARRFVTPVERQHDLAAATRLRRLVAPFLLRREKTDPAVISDLPPKIERNVVCPLTHEQAALYADTVEQAMASLDDATRMERRGRVLALLTHLKQICNHPAHFLGEKAPELVGRSGKFAALREIVGEVTDAGDRVLVFSQYVQMGRLLVTQLQADLAVAVPFLHGGTPARGRERLVEAFQAGEPGYPGDPSGAPPVLVVSLRAGGTGLNLTAATHVVHYDRWWNPAVEDQATDRVHRIGQRRTVEVHKLVTAGTVEERIDELLSAKRALTERVITAAESWITDLGDHELRELVALSADASIGDLDEDDEMPVGRRPAGVVG
jgi:superfamily II DNA or RNA helicase